MGEQRLFARMEGGVALREGTRHGNACRVACPVRHGAGEVAAR